MSRPSCILLILIAVAGCSQAGPADLRTGKPSTDNSELARLPGNTSRPPDDRDIRRQHAAALWQSGSHQQAVKELRALVELAPEDPTSVLLLARVLMDAGRSDEARPVLLRAEGRWPASATPHLLLGYLYRRQGRPQEAESAFRECLLRADTPSEQVSALLGLGAVLEKTGLISEAEDNYHRALLIYPDLAQVLKDVETDRLWPRSIHTDAYRPPSDVRQRLRNLDTHLANRDR